MNKASKMEDFNKNDRSKIYQRFSIHGNFWHTSLPELMDKPNNGVSTADIPSWPLMEAGKICDQMKICDHYFEFNLVNLLLKSWISWSQICLKNYIYSNFHMRLIHFWIRLVQLENPYSFLAKQFLKS